MLKVMADGNRNWALFSPGDSRMPRMMIPADQMPAGFFERPQDFSKYIFAAHMVEWQATAQFARGFVFFIRWPLLVVTNLLVNGIIF